MIGSSVKHDYLCKASNSDDFSKWLEKYQLTPKYLKKNVSCVLENNLQEFGLSGTQWFAKQTLFVTVDLKG